jgi:hypothetical protein
MMSVFAGALVPLKQTLKIGFNALSVASLKFYSKFIGTGPLALLIG